MSIDQIKDHIRNRPYMDGVMRNAVRIKATQEIFTPTEMVKNLLDGLDQTLFVDITQPFVDPSCGDGQFLGEVLIRKIENGSTFEQALQTIYGVDLMPDNVDLCRKRLLCGQEHLRHIVEQNIVCADALRYHYRFDSSHPYDDEVKAHKKQQHFASLFTLE
jgi:alpha-tubulin suppressor-like RCC1 family protein